MWLPIAISTTREGVEPERCQVNSPSFATHSRADISTTGIVRKLSRDIPRDVAAGVPPDRASGDSATSRHRTRILNLRNTLRALGLGSVDSLPGTAGMEVAPLRFRITPQRCVAMAESNAECRPSFRDRMSMTASI